MYAWDFQDMFREQKTELDFFYLTAWIGSLKATA